MGYGTYSFDDRTVRATNSGFYTKTVHEVTAHKMDSEMNPMGVKIRESRDSQEHPNTVSVLLALDLTGSMYDVPEYLVRDGLPHTIEKLMQGGISDPQLLFIGVGDHEYDRAPLQVGQFESSDELLDKWLTKVWLEGRGGGNEGESYLLAWYFGAYHTALDSLEKRGKKGYLITIGDEPTLKNIPGSALDKLMGGQHNNNYSAIELLKKAQEKYNVYHIHVTDTSRGADPEIIGGWKQLIGDNLTVLDNHKLVAATISKIIVENEKKYDDAKNDAPQIDDIENDVDQPYTEKPKNENKFL